MAKFLRQNKVVIVLNGRFAGKKAVIVKNTYRSSNKLPFVGWMEGRCKG